MIGALTGDIVGSIYEWNNHKSTEFPLFQDRCRFTDDSVLTVALAEAILTGESFELLMRQYYRRYPEAGYGSSFHKWARDPSATSYQSFGNGAAMRISPVGWAYHTLPEVLQRAREYTVITHDHPEGVKGAQATAGALFLARNGCSKGEIAAFVTERFGYDLTRSCAEIRAHYRFDVSCQGTLPAALSAFLESSDFEHALRLAVSLGGDSDTIACITGAVAEGFYGGVPAAIAGHALTFLDDSLREVTLRFAGRFLGEKALVEA